MGHSFRVLVVGWWLFRRSFRPTVTERRRFQRLQLQLSFVLPNLSLDLWAFAPLCSAEFVFWQHHYIASSQLALLLCDKMLCVKTDAFFSGGNSCVPSVASERSSSDKFPNPFLSRILASLWQNCSSNVKIRQNDKEFYRSLSFSIRPLIFLKAFFCSLKLKMTTATNATSPTPAATSSETPSDAIRMPS